MRINNKLDFVAKYSEDAWAATISTLKIDKGSFFQIFTSASILLIFALEMDSFVLQDFGKMSKLACQLV